MIKRYTDFTNEELLNLTDEDIENLIDVECMFAGVVPIRIEPTYMDVPELPETDTEVYNVGNFTFGSFEEADRVKNLINECKSICRIRYDYMYGYENGYVTHNDDYACISKQRTYTEKTFEKAKDIIIRRNNIIKDNKAMLDEFKEASRDYTEIRDKVYDAVYNAKKEHVELENARRVYDRYLALSNGDEATADKFFAETEFSRFLEAIRGSEH